MLRHLCLLAALTIARLTVSATAMQHVPDSPSPLPDLGSAVAYRAYVDAIVSHVVANEPKDRSTNLMQAVNVVHASAFKGRDLGAQINAADQALGKSSGEIWVTKPGLIFTSIKCSENHTIRFFPGTYRLHRAGLTLSSGCSVIGASSSVVDGQGTLLQRDFGDIPMIRISGSGPGSGNVQNVLIANIGLHGGMLAGEGILIQYANNVQIRGVSARYGGSGHALRVQREAWDFWIIDSSLTNWGNRSTPIVALEGLNSYSAIRRGFWIRNQIGEIGTDSSILVANAFVAEQHFVDVKFHFTGARMPFMIDWAGSESAWLGCSFQGAGPDTSFLVRVGPRNNKFLGGGVNDSGGADAFQIAGGGDGAVLIAGMTIVAGIGHGVGINVLPDVTSTAKLLLGNNIFQNSSTAILVRGAPTLVLGTNLFDSSLGNHVLTQ